MCKKYVNAIVDCFEEIISSNSYPAIPVSFQRPFDEIMVDYCDGKYQTGSFKLVTNINILGTADKSNQATHILYRENGALDFIIRLTRCDKDPEKRDYYDLDSFQVNVKQLKDNNQIDGACFSFVNYPRITTVPPLDLQEAGQYVIKLLIKENTEEKYSVQFIKKLTVKASTTD